MTEKTGDVTAVDVQDAESADEDLEPASGVVETTEGDADEISAAADE